MSSKKQIMLWWFYGIMTMFFGLMALRGYYRTPQSDFYLYLKFFNLIVFTGVFIWQIIVQRPQFSLRSLFIVNFVVAILCSIYLCFGLKVLNLVLLALMFASLFYALIITQKKKDEE